MHYVAINLKVVNLGARVRTPRVCYPAQPILAQELTKRIINTSFNLDWFTKRHLGSNGEVIKE